jgi:dye decolorizing peroxidase
MNLDRRNVLMSAAALAAGAAGVYTVSRTTQGNASVPAASTGAPVYGAHQAGVDRPVDPQSFALLSVLDVSARTRGEVADVLARLGRMIGANTSDRDGDLTVTVGIGPRLTRLAGIARPGQEPLPTFAGDHRIVALYTGGDLLLAIHGSDADRIEKVRDHLVSTMSAHERWAQHGFRHNAGDGRARNPLGFLDGVVIPRTAAELKKNVWIPDGPAADGTVCVVRRLKLDVERFRSLPIRRQERIIGRRLSGGAPLSGAGPFAQVDLEAKTPDGEYVVPEHAHARAAHPSFTGSHLMLRRSYSYENGRADQGVLFVSFQRDLATFVRTQQRLDEVDELMRFATTTASGSFLVLPGFDHRRPLGATLFG